MPSFSRRSLERLDTCCDDLRSLFLVVVETVDCTILCGHRTEEEQNDAYRRGVSRLRWPRSKHNSIPSLAVDVAPYHKETPHVRWTDKDSWYWFAGYVQGVADGMEIHVRWGGDWDGDRDFRDNRLVDLPHWELVR